MYHYTEEQLQSMKKVEAARAANAVLEPRRMTAEEKEQVVEVILRGTLREPVLYSPLRDAIEPAEFARIDERTVRAKFTIAPLETVIVLGNENIQ